MQRRNGEAEGRAEPKPAKPSCDWCQLGGRPTGGCSSGWLRPEGPRRVHFKMRASSLAAFGRTLRPPCDSTALTIKVRRFTMSAMRLPAALHRKNDAEEPWPEPRGKMEKRKIVH